MSYENSVEIDKDAQISARWIKRSDADGIYWACSECEYEIPRVNAFNPQFDLFPKLKSLEKTSYCPNCGEKMR